MVSATTSKYIIETKIIGEVGPGKTDI